MPITTNKNDLTAAEKRCLEVFRKLSLLHRVPPTGEELAAEMGVTRQTAFYHLNSLITKGRIRRLDRRSRALEIVSPRQRTLKDVRRAISAQPRVRPGQRKRSA